MVSQIWRHAVAESDLVIGHLSSKGAHSAENGRCDALWNIEEAVNDVL